MQPSSGVGMKRYCQPGPLHIRDGKLFDRDGADFAIHGVNWFGLELSKGVFDGLNATDGFGNDLDSALVRNWKVVAARIKLLGFNTIRLTFSFSVRWPSGWCSVVVQLCCARHDRQLI